MDTAHTTPAFETDQQIRAAMATLQDDRRDNWDDMDLYLTALIWRGGGLSHGDFSEEIEAWLARRSRVRQHRLEVLQQRLGVQAVEVSA